MGDNQNAYDKFLQNYVMYGMSDPNGLYTNYQGGYDYPGAQSSEQTTSEYNNEQSNDRGGYKSGNQQRGGYQQQNNNNNFNNNNYNNNNNFNKNNSNPGYNNRNNNRNFNEGSNANNGDTIVQKDTIFIQNLPKNVSVSELEQSFGSIGIIKIDKKTGNSKIWIYKDKVTGEGKGEATVTYDDEEAATAAINWFNNKEILGCIVKIQLATRKNNFNNFNKGGNRNYGGQGSNYGNRGDDNRGGNRGGGGGGGNRFNDRRNDRNNDRRGGGSSGGSGGYRNQSGGGGGGGYSRPAPY